MSVLSQLTSPPPRSVRTIVSPSTRWLFTDSVRPEVRYTISAYAEAAWRHRAAAAAWQTRILSFMRDRHPSIGPLLLSRITTVELVRSGKNPRLRCIGKLLRLDERVKHADSQLTRVAAPGLEGSIGLDSDFRHVPGAEL